MNAHDALQEYKMRAARFREARDRYERSFRGYAKLQVLHRAMLSAEAHARYRCAHYKGRGHWAPSTFDSTLPILLEIEARDIGRRLRERLESEWSETHKCALLGADADWPCFLDAKEQHRILVAAYIDALPQDDPDLARYNDLRQRAKQFCMPNTPPAGFGQSRHAKRRRNWRNKPKNF